MADNIVLNSGSGGATIATDDDGTAHHQYVKLEFGADNTFTKVTATQGLPTDPLDRATRDMGKIDVAMGQGAHDAPGASLDPVAIGGYASATAPSAVSTDGDICRIWTTPSGAVHVADGNTTLSVDDGAGSLTIDNAALSVTGGGVEAAALRVTLASDSTGVLSVDDNGSTLSVDDGGGSLTIDNAALGVTGGGVEASALRVTIANDSTGLLSVDDNGGSLTVDNAGTFVVQENGAALTALQTLDNPVLVDDAAFTPASSSVMMAGFTVDETTTDSADEGDAAAARITPDRKVIVTSQPHTAGGLSIFRSLDLDETEEDVKTSAGCVYGMWVTNTATTTRWVKFYNETAANVVVGTTTPVLTIGIPGNSSDDITGLFSTTNGIQFSTAICVAATTGVADSDTGAPAANDVIVNIFYK
jgi:hypothetical protein